MWIEPLIGIFQIVKDSVEDRSITPGVMFIQDQDKNRVKEVLSRQGIKIRRIEPIGFDLFTAIFGSRMANYDTFLMVPERQVKDALETLLANDIDVYTG